MFSLQVPAADFAITKSADLATVNLGSNVTYTLTATNGGPYKATAVTVTDTLPGTVTFVSASTGCNESGGTVTCTTASPISGASVQFTVTVTAPNTAGSISNAASVTSNRADPDLSNDSVTVVTAVVVPSADLSVAKSASPVVPLAGQNMTYTITVTNNGPEIASSITLVDGLPSSVAFVSASAGCFLSSGAVFCTASSLASGDSLAFTITVTAPILAGTISNSASVVASSPVDPDLSNNVVTLVTTIAAPAAVPSVSSWGLGALAFALAAGVLVARRRRKNSAVR